MVTYLLGIEGTMPLGTARRAKPQLRKYLGYTKFVYSPVMELFGTLVSSIPTIESMNSINKKLTQTHALIILI